MGFIDFFNKETQTNTQEIDILKARVNRLEGYVINEKERNSSMAIAALKIENYYEKVLNDRNDELKKMKDTLFDIQAKLLK